jgi:hypothetical protein
MSTIKDVDTLLAFLANTFIVRSVDFTPPSLSSSQGIRDDISSHQRILGNTSSVSSHIDKKNMTPQDQAISADASPPLTKPAAQATPIPTAALQKRLLLPQTPNPKKSITQNNGDDAAHMEHGPWRDADSSVYGPSTPEIPSLASEPAAGDNKKQRRNAKTPLPILQPGESDKKKRKGDQFWRLKKFASL